MSTVEKEYYPKEENKEISVPEFLTNKNFQEKEPVIDEGCSEVLMTVKQEMPLEVVEKLNSIRNNKEVVTDRKKEQLRTTINSLSDEEKRAVCELMPPQLLIDTISKWLSERDVMKREIEIISRHVSNV